MTNSNYANWKKGKIAEDTYRLLYWAHEVRTTKGYHYGMNKEADAISKGELIAKGEYYIE